MECLFGDECPLHSIICALCDFHERQFKIENWVLKQDKHNFSFYVLDPQGKKYNIYKGHFLAYLEGVCNFRYPENFHLHREFIFEDLI